MRLYFAYIYIKICKVSKNKHCRLVSGVHRDVNDKGRCFTSGVVITDPSTWKAKWRSRLGLSLCISEPSSVNAFSIRDLIGFVWCPPSGTFLHHFQVKFISSHLHASVFFHTQPVSIYLALVWSLPSAGERVT